MPRRAGERYGVSDGAILVRRGKRKLVGKQEDQIIDIANALAAERKASRGADFMPHLRPFSISAIEKRAALVRA